MSDRRRFEIPKYGVRIPTSKSRASPASWCIPKGTLRSSRMTSSRDRKGAIGERERERERGANRGEALQAIRERATAERRDRGGAGAGARAVSPERFGGLGELRGDSSPRPTKGRDRFDGRSDTKKRGAPRGRGAPLGPSLGRRALPVSTRSRSGDQRCSFRSTVTWRSRRRACRTGAAARACPAHRTSRRRGRDRP